MEETRDVYIGNDQTIKVTPNEKLMYLLDIDKLEKMFNENPHEELVVGATGDWYWTAETIHNKEEFEEKRKGYGLLRASSWSRFSINQEDDCTVEVPIHFYRLVREHAFLDGMHKVDQWIFNLYKDGIVNMKYEVIKEMQKELEPIIKKYIAHQ